MKIKVRIFGYLRTFCDQKTSDEIAIDLPDNSTTHNLLQALFIPEKEDVMIVVNNVSIPKGNRVLEHQDEVLIYPFLGGG